MKKTVKLSDLKKGGFFKFKGKNKIYKYTGKVRMYDKWGKYKGFGFSYVPVDDVWSGGIETLTNREINTIFEY